MNILNIFNLTSFKKLLLKKEEEVHNESTLCFWNDVSSKFEEEHLFETIEDFFMYSSLAFNIKKFEKHKEDIGKKLSNCVRDLQLYILTRDPAITIKNILAEYSNLMLKSNLRSLNVKTKNFVRDSLGRENYNEDVPIDKVKSLFVEVLITFLEFKGGGQSFERMMKRLS
jgi:hypothetical protein